MPPKLFFATKAFINFNGRILILRESSKYEDGANASKFDVVGGRVEPGQRFDESLMREIKEETGLVVTIGCPFHVGEWRPTVRGEQWQIIGTYFECIANSDQVVLSDDHDEHQWIDPNDHHNFPIIENLRTAFERYLVK